MTTPEPVPDYLKLGAPAPNAGMAGSADGRRMVGDDERVTAGARALAADLWRGGGDEAYHFLLYLCGHAARTVQAATDKHDRENAA